MPLTSTGMPGTADVARKAIAFWMTDAGASPPKQVRVFVTFIALEEIDPSAVRDQVGAFGTFNKNRKRIEEAASKKFDATGTDDGKYETLPILTVRSTDI